MKNENIGITLHQLKIFWTVAQASSFTKASKILGLAQPSLSQQISKLEDEVGSLLFKRGRSKMSLTEAGLFLQRRSEIVLSGVEETMVGLRQFGSGQKGLISVGLLSSVARNLLPAASEKLAKKFPEIELDILEISPAEAIDLLYGRQLSVAVLAEDSIAKSILSFSKSYLFEDPKDPRYVTPDSIFGAQIDNVIPDHIISQFGDQVQYYPPYALYRAGVDSRRFERETKTRNYKFDLTSQVNKYNQVKFGFDITEHDLFLDSYSILDSTQTDKIFSPKIPLPTSVAGTPAFHAG